MTKYEAGDEILFEDIKKGDKLRRTTTYHDGATSVYEGIASRKGSFYWETDSDLTLAYASDGDDSDTLVELVERPEAPLPETPGTIIKAKKVRGSVGEFILYRTDDDSWRSYLAVIDKGYGGSYYWHPEDRIEDWELMELVAKN